VPLSIAAIVIVSATVSVMVAERQGHLPPDADHSVSAPPPAATQDENRAAPGPFGGQSPAASRAKSDDKRRLAAERPRQAAPQESTAPPQAGSEVFSESRTQDSSKGEQAAAQASTQNLSVSAAKQQARPPTAAPPAAPGRPEPLGDEAPSHERAAAARDQAVPEELARALRKEGAQQSLVPAPAKLERDRVVAERKSLSAGAAWERDPEAWLKHIDELRLAGRGADAEASFRAFRDRYPDHPLPAGFVVPGR